MRRRELDHVLRAASRIAGDPDVVVIGSQPILGSFHEDDLPEEAHASIEADVAFFDDPHNDKSDQVDMDIGEDSQFHVTFGYYAQGVDVSTATLPPGWRERIVRYQGAEASEAIGHCLEPHDLVISKLVAHRPKDLEFAGALLHARLVEFHVLLARAQSLDVPLMARSVTSWLPAWQRRHGGEPAD